MKRIFEAILVFILAGFIFYFFFINIIPDGLSNLNEYLFSTTHDGIKNYYTYLYYLKYDDGFHFTGMAYPYGDLITFTDNQPLVVLTLKFLGSLGLVYQGNAIGIFNMLLLINLPLTVLIIFKILKYYNIDFFSAFLIALILTFLNPQIERLAGHYALAYSFVIPMLWWFDIKLQNSTAKFGWLLLIITVILLVTFLHVYYLAVAFLFYLFVGLGHLIKIGYTRIAFYRISMLYIPLAMVPMFVFKAFMISMDNVHDRVTHPYGFLNYRATYRSLFFSDNSPLDWVYPSFIRVGKLEFEGHSYLGIFAILFTTLILIRAVKYMVQHKYINLDAINITKDERLNPYIILAILALCISAAFPFYMPPFDYLIEYLTPLAQFRSPGRFAWIFYMIFGVSFYIFIYYFSSQSGSKNWRKLIFPVILLIGLYESIGTAKNTFNNLDKTTLASKYLKRDLDNQFNKFEINTNKYQAIIAFPFYTIGNEKAGYAGNDESIFQSMKISYQTGLPLVNYGMSRMGVCNGLKIMALTSNAVLPKLYIQDISSTKPFLLVLTSEYLTKNESDIVNVATPLFSSDKLSFYSLNVMQLHQLYQQKVDSIKYQKWIRLNNNFYTNDTINQFLHFDEHVNLNDLFETNTNLLNLKNINILFEGTLPSNDSLDISFWTISNNKYSGFPNMKIFEYNKDNKEVFKYNSHVDYTYEIYKSSRLISYKYKPQSDSNKVVIQIVGKNYNFGNFLIKKTQSQVLIKNSFGDWFWNNYPIDSFSLK
jgi:hypothetical protein